MGYAFHFLCPRCSGTLTLTAPMAIRLWDTFILYLCKHPLDKAHIDTTAGLKIIAFLYDVLTVALRMAKTPWSFGHSGCNRVKLKFNLH